MAGYNSDLFGVLEQSKKMRIGQQKRALHSAFVCVFGLALDFVLSCLPPFGRCLGMLTPVAADTLTQHSLTACNVKLFEVVKSISMVRVGREWRNLVRARSWNSHE
jgi:hypothetical protein